MFAAATSIEQLRQQAVRHAGQLPLEVVSLGIPQAYVPLIPGSLLSRRSQLLEIERPCGLHARGAQEGARTTPAIRHGLEGNRAGGAACRPAVDASEVVERLVDIVRAATASHGVPPGD